jgi:aryl-alcohol dehydrogenase-like predicted oxidoreductase
MWGGTDDEDAIESIRAAVDAGMSTIDTAPMYGFGHSEKVVGRAIADLAREDVVICTKCGLRWDLEEGQEFFDTTDRHGNEYTVYRNLKKHSILEEIDRSLERLGVDYVDLYQCHWPDNTTEIPETMEALNQILEEGKARAVGVSNFTPEMIEECLEHGTIVSNQPEYCMLCRDIEEGVLPCCRKNDVGVIVYSPLHQGLLTGKVTMDREFEEGDQRNWKPWFQPINRRRALDFLDKVRPIAEKHDKTLAQVAINWVLCQDGITSAIVGARNPQQVQENAEGAGWRLTEEELAQIREWLEDLGGPVR